MKRTLGQAGEVVKARRKALRLTVKEAAARGAISHTTWYVVEKGERSSDDTLLGVCRALDWSDDSFELVLGGKAPVEEDRSEDRSSDPGEALAVAVRDLTEVVRELRADLAEGRRPGPSPPGSAR